MRLYDALPYTVKVDGRAYQINPSFDRVLEALDILAEPGPAYRKQAKLLYLFFTGRRKPKNQTAAVSAVFSLLLPHGEETPQTRLIDFEQDADLLFCAFQQAYGIDLWMERGRMHWLRFQTLLSGLPSDTALSGVIKIRSEKIPAVTKSNREYVGELIRLKQKYKIQLTPEEEAASRQRELSKIARAVITMAQKGDIKSG